MTRHYRNSVYTAYNGTPTNQCSGCGARYLASDLVCPFHRDVEVWVRGCLVRFVVIEWPPDKDAGILFASTEILGMELVGTTHFRSYQGLLKEGLTQGEEDAVAAAYWDVEEHEEDCTVYRWRDWLSDDDYMVWAFEVTA